jgi:hypothetical protein
MDATTNLDFNNIAVTVAALVAVALALATAIGPTVMYITEALKKAFNVSDGKGGLVALVMSIILTAILSVVTTYTTQDSAGVREYVAALGVGAVLGIFVGGGAVQSYKAAGSINNKGLTELIADLNTEPDDYYTPSANPFPTLSSFPEFSDDVSTEPKTQELMAKGPNV